MEQKEIRLNLLLNISAIATIMISVAASMFQFETLRVYCVCISNYMAWGLIAIGVSLLAGLAWNFISSPKLLKLLLGLQALLFFTGIVLLVLFGSFLNNVI